ncbi:EVE domain-containing protein [candidate division WOR-3 bacterium]|nr:EVE domain-containing protein [candidate division WOR-3 bacterium]
MTLSTILNLVGKLDDTPGKETPRERFRKHLYDNVTEVGQVRDYVEECLRLSGDQYNRALQDLVNYIGHFLEFTVRFGRYKGVRNELGYDGFWRSPSGLNIVVEVKTTDAYTIDTAVLAGYVNELISQGEIPSWDDTLGLYVVGRPDSKLKQLEDAIVAQKRLHQLRIMSVESLLSLAEMMNEYDVSHDDILSVIKPSGPTIDPVVDLMGRLVAQEKAVGFEEETKVQEEQIIETKPNEEQASYWVTPVKTVEERTAEDAIRILVGESKIYAFSERTPGRRHIKPGDWICFYATGTGVIAHARVKTKPKKEHHGKVHMPEKYPWVFHLDNPVLYLNKPVVIDSILRSKLDAFEGRLKKAWAWFVQATRKITKHDFEVLTRRETQ